ncbi:MAG: hypothetical protein A6F71_09865 [Cycloclasticus sp. symbiont of Poecilosclerida sp. M]|nr:MAG: hypothetical protein A6F71_09865 [Cycloclasticus sp. symbiont of Poecilosclerida sp. M]
MDDVSCSVETFHQQLTRAYPKLLGGGGFELLMCRPNTRELEVLSARVSSSPQLLKDRIGKGRVYIRPIQRDLSLEEEEEDQDFEQV